MTENWVNQSLEACAELDIDITEAVYERFFAACPAAIPLMGHSDEHMRGRMLAQVLEFFFDDLTEDTSGYLGWEVDNHVQAYAVVADMYPPFLSALQDSVAAVLGDNWTPEHQNAWQHRIDAILTLIGERTEVH